MSQWFYINSDGDQQGPFSPRAIADLVATGVVTADTEVSRDGQRWVKASRVTGLLDSGRTAATVAGDEPEPAKVVLPVCYDYLRLWSILTRIAGVLCAVAGILLTVAMEFAADVNEEPAPHLSQAAATLTGLAACGSCFLTAALLSVIVDAGRKLHEIAASLRDRPL